MTRWIITDTRDGSKLGDFGSQAAATERLEKLNAEHGPYHVLRSVTLKGADARAYTVSGSDGLPSL